MVFVCIKVLHVLFPDLEGANAPLIMVEVDGREMRVYGTVLVDTLAAHQLGGFKVGVGFSLRKCRQCMVTFNDMQTQVRTLLLIFHYILCCIDYI